MNFSAVLAKSAVVVRCELLLYSSAFPCCTVLVVRCECCCTILLYNVVQRLNISIIVELFMDGGVAAPRVLELLQEFQVFWRDHWVKNQKIKCCNFFNKNL